MIFRQFQVLNFSFNTQRAMYAEKFRICFSTINFSYNKNSLRSQEHFMRHFSIKTTILITVRNLNRQNFPKLID